MIVAVHQPDLLPYSGFFYKMAKADIFDLKIGDQFLKRGYQRRVKMRDQWATIPTHPAPQTTSIFDIRMDPVEARDTLANFVRGRYRDAKYFKPRGTELVDRILDIHTDRLWAFNLELILTVRDMLGIRTPLSCGPPSLGAKSEGIISVLREYKATTYLSGTGARVYMGDCHEFTEAGIEVVFSPHKPVTGDSILSVLFDYPDPLEIVMLEEQHTTQL